MLVETGIDSLMFNMSTINFKKLLKKKDTEKALQI